MFTLGGKYSGLESVRLVVKFPEMKSPAGEVYSGIDRTQKTLLTEDARMVAFSYAFDEEWELIEGVWTVQIYDGSQLLGEAMALTIDPKKLDPKRPATPAGAKPATNDPIAVRLIELCTKRDVTAEDVAYLRESAAVGGPGECLSRAILFKHSAADHGDQFRQYFAIDRSLPATVLENDAINLKVNGVMTEFKGRPPAEIVARVYLSMRGEGFVARKSDGTELNLEVMFRASVFAAVNGGSKETVLFFAAEADRK
ncbi:MAG: hypothetical protein QM760_04220 [Nibricoccus sp.]